jgi:hypothetical protein
MLDPGYNDVRIYIAPCAGNRFPILHEPSFAKTNSSTKKPTRTFYLMKPGEYLTNCFQTLVRVG